MLGEEQSGFRGEIQLELSIRKWELSSEEGSQRLGSSRKEISHQ